MYKFLYSKKSEANIRISPQRAYYTLGILLNVYMQLSKLNSCKFYT
jgi:hypothetical protein